MFSSEPGPTLLLVGGVGRGVERNPRQRKKRKNKNPGLDSFLPSIMFQKYLE